MIKRARFRADLEIFSRRDGASKAGRVVHWIHHPIAGTVARLPDEDFRQLRDQMETTDTTRQTASLTVGDAGLFEEAKRIGFVADQPAFGASSTNSSTANSTTAKWWRNPLYIKLPGVPADSLAIRLAKFSGWLFSPVATTFWGLVFLISSVALLTQASAFWKSLIQLADFQAQYWFLSLVVLGLTKVLHELGHAAVCRRMGASCREIGALFLCGTPCLYCDVSESWRVDSRGARAWIMMAGIYVEWVIASVAAWIWLLKNGPGEPSFTQMLAVHIIMVCGVSTFLFNINPLMRYDGYYVLSDALNVMNLRTTAINAWRNVIVKPLAGLSAPTLSGKSTAFATYHAASIVYRYVVMSAILGWLYLILTRCGLEPIGRAAIIVVVAIVAVAQSRKWWQMVRGIGFWGQVSKFRRTILAAGIAAGLILILVVPFDYRIVADGTVDFADAATIYAPATATVAAVPIEFGQTVESGQLLFTLSAPELLLEREISVAEVRKLEISRASYQRRATNQPELHAVLALQDEQLKLASANLDSVETKLKELQLRSSNDGVVYPLRTINKMEPLHNLLGSTQESGASLCRIANPKSKQIVLQIDAIEHAQISVGKSVRIQIESLTQDFSGGVFESQVMAISPLDDQGGQFEVVCDLSISQTKHIPVGSRVTGVFHGKRTRLAELIADRLLGKLR